ncbi:MAG: LamG domain-containing protein [Mesorhizobium sp.]|nr:MAG: LamG domain-containing protein [Mesorhizobium sp.]
MAINFAGGTDRISYGNGFNDSKGCFAFWMKTTQVTVNAAPLAVWSASSRNGFGFFINNTLNKITAQGYDATTARITLTSTISINDGNWHHIAFNWNTANGGANALFIDGVSDATGNSSAAWSVSSIQPLYLGDLNDAFWPSYVGDLAEVASWHGSTRNLDAAEIAALGKGFSPKHIAPGALGFYAPLIRSPNNLRDAFIGSVVGTSVSDHCRIIG